jgi:hypothetical protein
MLTFQWYTDLKYRADDYCWDYARRPILYEVNVPYSKPSVLSATTFTACGAITGLGISIIACPFELLKIGSQTAATISKTNPKFDSNLTKVYQQKGPGLSFLSMAFIEKGGLRKLYSGWHLHARKFSNLYLNHH